jgi:hypothetical protein
MGHSTAAGSSSMASQIPPPGRGGCSETTKKQANQRYGWTIPLSASLNGLWPVSISEPATPPPCAGPGSRGCSRHETLVDIGISAAVAGLHAPCCSPLGKLPPSSWPTSSASAQRLPSPGNQLSERPRVAPEDSATTQDNALRWESHLPPTLTSGMNDHFCRTFINSSCPDHRAFPALPSLASVQRFQQSSAANPHHDL